MTPQMMHRLWLAWVRYWLTTKSVRDSRAYSTGPERNRYGVPVREARRQDVKEAAE